MTRTVRIAALASLAAVAACGGTTDEHSRDLTGAEERALDEAAARLDEAAQVQPPPLAAEPEAGRDDLREEH